MKVKLKLFDPMCMPYRSPIGEMYDLAAAKDVSVMPGTRPTMIPLGVAMEIPPKHVALLLPRSSTAGRHGIMLANSVGVIDSSYNGPNDEWQFPAVSHDGYMHMVRRGMRIAQFTVIPVPDIEFVDSDLVGNDDRGGFGTTGVGNETRS